MRLTLTEQDAIKSVFHVYFGPEDHLWLFGSRTDDMKRGGDIDLYVETHLNTDEAIKAHLRFLSSVKDNIGDQKIDLVLNVLNLSSSQPIYEIAKKGIQLL